jgi:hypothetical protein
MRLTSSLVMNTEKKLSIFLLEVDVDVHGRPLYQRVMSTAHYVLEWILLALRFDRLYLFTPVLMEFLILNGIYLL